MENQLKATELRPFNMLKVKGDSKDYYQVMAIDAINDKVYLNIPRNNWHDISKLKPIQLTEDILVKLGFEKTANPRELKYGDYSILLLNEIRFVIYNYMENPPSVKVSTVHQLQNLFFALTGEELTFKN